MASQWTKSNSTKPNTAVSYISAASCAPNQLVFGVQIGLSWAGIDGSWPALIYIHMIFILPYVWLVLAPAFVQLDKRHEHVAGSLGLAPFKRLLHVSLPILAKPIGAALFIGFSVSIALYLPTVFVGGGRIATITVEAVSLAANGSRGPAGLAAILQLLIPLSFYIMVWLFLRYRFGKFVNMKGWRIDLKSKCKWEYAYTER